MRSAVYRDRKQANQLPVDDPARQRIIALARRHFFAYGFRGVTMDDLAKELGMSKKTLYTHFSGKAALIGAALLDKSREIEKDLDRITSDCASDFLAALYQLLSCMQLHLEEFRPPFLRDVQRESPEMFKLVEERREDLIHRYFGKLLDEGRKSGMIREDIQAGLLLEIFLGAIQAIVNPKKLAELGLTPKEGFSAIITVILEGVITETGRSNL
ncbi:MAG: TetR/AcrR family transcriptional regulator [Desulfomonile tiedjei]|uniref:TetR/AcrR family transcriptional regulator n=1 Tax=Desulfomonile tiedjei TaxID=2358 RepID=A0A9D6Z2Q8_9BACT|nr:TetR/AcrR family transcriptional regulator [Desulfomonile tiedjei]